MFYNHFISFFGTNLLTWCQVPVAVFCIFFTSQEINIRRSPNATKLHDDFLWNIYEFWEVESTRDDARGAHEAGGAPLTLVDTP